MKSACKLRQRYEHADGLWTVAMHDPRAAPHERARFRRVRAGFMTPIMTLTYRLREGGLKQTQGESKPRVSKPTASHRSPRPINKRTFHIRIGSHSNKRANISENQEHRINGHCTVAELDKRRNRGAP